MPGDKFRVPDPEEAGEMDREDFEESEVSVCACVSVGLCEFAVISVCVCVCVCKNL